MQRYIARRVLLLFIVLLIVSVLVFLILRVIPGDIVDVLAGEEGLQLTKIQEEALRVRLGLAEPLHVQYYVWIKDIVRHGDFGTSIYYSQGINALLKQRLPVTLLLTLYSIGFMVLIGLPLGIVSALKANTMADHSARVFAVIGLSVPNFWLGILALITVVIMLNWSPPLGYVGPIENLSEHVQQMILPALIGGISFGAILARMTRSSMLEVLSDDYVRTARSKGLTERIVVARHVMPNAMLPILTIVSVQAAALIGGTVVLESVFSLPGFGAMIIDAVRNRDYPLVQSALLLVATGVILINLATDVLYAYIDPRIKYT